MDSPKGGLHTGILPFITLRDCFTPMQGVPSDFEVLLREVQSTWSNSDKEFYRIDLFTVDKFVKTTTQKKGKQKKRII